MNASSGLAGRIGCTWQQGGGAKNRRHLQHRRELSQNERVHSPISGRRVAWLGRPLHPVSGRTHPRFLRRQDGKVAYPRLLCPVNHRVPRTDTIHGTGRVHLKSVDTTSHNNCQQNVAILLDW